MYDEPQNTLELIRHFERKEPKLTKEIYYVIKKRFRDAPYRLLIDAMNINLYSTGVGFLSFYLKNDDDSQKEPADILAINQYGRRVLPPFFADIQNRYEIAEYIQIEGLYGNQSNYKETFTDYTPEDSWYPATFIRELIDDLSTNIQVEPIIDDRMFVASWYKNDELAKVFKQDQDAYCDCQNDFSSFWYRYLFVDSGDETCQNDKMKKNLLEKHTYLRWQKWSSLYGVSKYSLVYLTNNEVPSYLTDYFQTMYARMIELVLVQRASMLRFSGEVTSVSKLSHQETGIISNRISSLYKEYIRFINQVYFREVTAQDQGIELYDMLQSALKMEEYIKDLDNEIGELHGYVSLKEERDRNKKATLLNDIATIFLPITVITGFWGMNSVSDVLNDRGISLQSILLITGTLCALCIIYKRKNRL